VRREPADPRPHWRQAVEAQGLAFHTADGQPYWDESACYAFTPEEIDALEAATYRLDAMCLQAVEHVIAERRFAEVGIPAAFAGFVADSWERDEHTLYGRFDLAYDGSGPPKLLEYNADTPTALLEAAVVQWFWLRDTHPQANQFNSLHEHLIEAWGILMETRGPRWHFAAARGNLEDFLTVSYLRDTAVQAGLDTEYLDVDDIGWHAGRGCFTDLRERAVENLFKLYPWEWLFREEFGAHLPRGATRWLEPPWKAVLSNKGVLAVLWDLYPDSPYLLRAGFELWGDRYVRKPQHGREGANVTVVVDGRPLVETGGPFGGGPWVYQELRPLPDFSGHYPVLGSWMVNGYACGLGIREDPAFVTRNTSRFVPHYFP
jgi:glutathionylspermidine synthase